MLLTAVVIWGWTFVATKICLEHLDPVELLALRLLIAVPTLGVLILLRGVSVRPVLGRRAAYAGAAVFAVHFLIQITGLRFTSATNTGWIIGVSPLVMAVLASLFLHERPGARTVAGIFVATVGLLLLVSRGDLGGLGWLSSYGDWLVLASAHTWAIYTVVVRDLSRGHDPLAVTFAVMLPALVLMLVWMVGRGSDWSSYLNLPLDALLALLFLGVAGMAVAQSCWQAGVARVGATEAGTFLYLEPLATTALAVPYLGESFGPWGWIGGALMLGGVWFSQRGRV